jgi:hypothetical protein
LSVRALITSAVVLLAAAAIVAGPASAQVPDQQPEEAPREAWFTHAEGDYRFPLPKQWRIVDGNDDVDILMREGDEIAMFCRRTHLELGANTPKSLLRDLAEEMIGSDPDGNIWEGTVGDEEAVFAESFDGQFEQMFWHVYFHHNARIYYVGFASAPRTDPSKMFPVDALIMLKGIEYLR